jgi:hypothetical protein
MGVGCSSASDGAAADDAAAADADAMVVVVLRFRLCFSACALPEG